MVVIFESIELTGDLPLVMIGVYSIVGTIAVVFALLIVDHVGRRRMLRMLPASPPMHPDTY
jgi:hypothetical protein